MGNVGRPKIKSSSEARSAKRKGKGQQPIISFQQIIRIKHVVLNDYKLVEILSNSLVLTALNITLKDLGLFCFQNNSDLIIIEKNL